MQQDGNARRLRELLAAGFVQLPACFSPLTAQIAQHVGFEAIYMSGGATSMVAGLPDVGLSTQTEMVDALRRITAAVQVPVVVDADTGYGNAVNIFRTVREYERAGASGFHLEDQEFPKKCGYLSGKRLVPAEEQAHKIRAACDARSNPDTVVIARTDALQVSGWDDVVARLRLYREAGADMVFVDGVRSPDVGQYVSRVVQTGVPTLYNGLDIDSAEAARLGFAAAIQAVAFYAGYRAEYEALAWLRANGSTFKYPGAETAPPITDIVGLPAVTEIERRYCDEAPPENNDDAQWERAFALLAGYVAQEGHTRVPRDFAVGGFPLGLWVEDTQRAVNEIGGRQDILTPDRRTRLEGLPAWRWTPSQR